MDARKILRVLTIALLGVGLSGCAEMARQQALHDEQEREAEQALKERIQEMSPEERNATLRCSSTAVGRIQALRNAGQGNGTWGINDFTIVNACISNPYYAETIPAPAVVVNNPAPVYQSPPLPHTFNCTTMQMGGGMSSTNCQ